MRNTLILIISFIATYTFAQNDNAKNVILLIADGTGIGQISSGMYAQEDDYTSYQRFLNIGFHKQHSSSHLITDSAAGATAFSCGVKTYNGAIGVDQDTLAVKTILEEAEERGMSTGLVATSTIVHATPASFIAHVPYRKQYEEIASDFLNTEIDYFVGGGLKYYNQRDSDHRDLVEELNDKGYTVKSYLDYSFNDFVKAVNDKQEIADSKLAFFTARKDPLPHFQGRDYLIEAGIFGLDFLKAKSEENGFFIMIEGSQVDWGGHANNQEYLIDEMKEFDELVGKVLDWAEKDGETLVIVTGDHECGGVAISSKSRRDSLVLDFTSDYHTGVMIPVFAYGPGSESFRGIYQNIAIYNKMRESLGWETQHKE